MSTKLKPLDENDTICVQAGCWHPKSYHLTGGSCLISHCECQAFSDTRETMPSDRARLAAGAAAGKPDMSNAVVPVDRTFDDFSYDIAPMVKAIHDDAPGVVAMPAHVCQFDSDVWMLAVTGRNTGRHVGNALRCLCGKYCVYSTDAKIEVI
jgi:hypothetical protein